MLDETLPWLLRALLVTGQRPRPQAHATSIEPSHVAACSAGRIDDIEQFCRKEDAVAGLARAEAAREIERQFTQLNDCPTVLYTIMANRALDDVMSGLVRRGSGAPPAPPRCFAAGRAGALGLPTVGEGVSPHILHLAALRRSRCGAPAQLCSSQCADARMHLPSTRWSTLRTRRARRGMFCSGSSRRVTHRSATVPTYSVLIDADGKFGGRVAAIQGDASAW